MINFEASVEKSNGSVVNCYTTSMEELMDFLSKYEKDYQWVIDHETGELLYRANHPTEEDYSDEHFQLMCLGWALTEPEPEPDPREEIIRDILEVCEEFGVQLTIPKGMCDSYGIPL